MVPRLLVNLKLYPEASGARAVALAKAAAKAERDSGVTVALAPHALDVRDCVGAGARVFLQHLDVVKRPESTGWLSAALAKEAGVEGTLLNHSEHRLLPEDLEAHIGAAHAAGIVTILCTRDSEETGRLAALRPKAVAVEPPELIGGEISVTTANPQVVVRSVQAVRRSVAGLPVLCGAGVKGRADVSTAVKLGAHGVLVASGVARAKRPSEALRDLVAGFR